MKEKPIRVKLGRKQTAPRNLAAKSLAEGLFKPKVEPDPKGYRRKAKHKVDPLAKAGADDE
jgi:stalled ribosome alternative rescue factor ArfA